MTTTCDCIVLGVGGFGSAAAYHAARRGARTLGLEQFDAVHDRGSSHGESRIIRRAYFEHADYVPLVTAAYGRWAELEAAAGRRLYTKTGLLLSGRLHGDVIQGTRQSAREHRLGIDDVPLADARRLFPMFRFSDDDAVLYEADAGYLRVEACVRTHIEQAGRSGADLRFGETCVSWTADGHTVQVTTDRGRYEAAALIVTAGAWAARVLADLDLPLTVRRKVQFWHPVHPAHVGLHQASPCFLFDRPGGTFYGFPCIDGQTIKIAEHSGGSAVDDPAHVDRACHDEDVRPIEQFVRTTIPNVDPRPRAHSVCMYTMAPRERFIVDRHPRFRNVIVAAGFSGHGFKFTPAIGEALADLALGETTSLPIGFLAMPPGSRTANREE
jgi:sarcosine oxidase